MLVSRILTASAQLLAERHSFCLAIGLPASGASDDAPVDGVSGCGGVKPVTDMTSGRTGLSSPQFRGFCRGHRRNTQSRKGVLRLITTLLCCVVAGRVSIRSVVICWLLRSGAAVLLWPGVRSRYRRRCHHHNPSFSLCRGDTFCVRHRCQARSLWATSSARPRWQEAQASKGSYDARRQARNLWAD